MILEDKLTIEHMRSADSDDLLGVMRQIAQEWPNAVLDRQQPVLLTHLVTVPDGSAFVVYRDHASMFEHRRCDGKPDPSTRIQIEVQNDRLAYVVDEWTSASGRLVRRLVGIDRGPRPAS